MLWLGAMKKRSTLSREETKAIAIAIVYARDAHLRRVSNRWGAGAPEKNVGPFQTVPPDVFCLARVIELLFPF